MNEFIETAVSKEPENLVSHADSKPVNRRPSTHRLAGNQAVQRLIQARLAVRPPDDHYEKEADQVAEVILGNGRFTPPPITPLASQATQKTCACGRSAVPNGVMCAACQSKHPTPTDTDHVEQALATGTGQPMEPDTREQFETRFGQDFSQVRVHTHDKAAVSAKTIHARAYTSGQDIAFASGEYAPHTTAGQHLLAHELTHVVQQGGQPHAIQRDDGDDDELEAPTANPETAQQDQEWADLLSRVPEFTGINLVEQAGGLRGLARNYPNTYAIVRERMIAVSDEETFAGLYRNDEAIMRIVNNAELIYGHISDLQHECFEQERWEAYDWLEQYATDYYIDYTDAASLYYEYGDGFIFVYTLLTNDPEATMEDLQRGAETRQTDYDEHVEAGESVVGSTIAERDVFMWFNDTVTLEEVIEPLEGEEEYRQALVWATISGYACAVLQVQGRYYVYKLSHQYSLDDVLATGFDRRSELLERGELSGITITTTDGVILSARDTRYFVRDQTTHPDENLEAEQSVLTEHGEELTADQAFLLFKRMVRDAALSNLAHARRELSRELASFFEMGIPTPLAVKPAAGRELQRDTAALRRHLIHAANLAATTSDDPSEAELAQIEETLSAIGRIQARNPTAALMVINNRDEDETGPVEDEDFEDRVAGMRSGDAALTGARELQHRLNNIERVENYLLQNPDAVLSMTPLHEPILNQFSSSQCLWINLRIGFHTLEELAEALGMAALDLAITITGVLVGGPLGLAIGGIATLHGVSQTIEGFERVDLLEAMTELDLHGEFALATPEMVSSARTWAWIGAGLTLLDVGGFVHEARHLARLQSVLASPDLAHVLSFVRRDFGEAATALGKSERELARELAAARGAERVRLVEQIREALESRAAGGRYGYGSDWDELYNVASLNRMREALMADTGDIDRVVEALNGFGIPMDRTMVAAIKRYNFDSPGIAFTRTNYEAWMRISSGRGTIFDARYLVHEQAELRAFSGRGYEPMPEAWESMGRHARTRWHREFKGEYLRAHGAALGEEFEFMAQQVNRVMGGRVSITPEVAAAIDSSFSGRDARRYMRVGDYTLADHPNFYSWQSRADEIVPLDATLRASIGREAIVNGIILSGGASTRATAVWAGADPTLSELIGIVKRMRI